MLPTGGITVHRVSCRPLLAAAATGGVVKSGGDKLRYGCITLTLPPHYLSPFLIPLPPSLSVAFTLSLSLTKFLMSLLICCVV